MVIRWLVFLLVAVLGIAVGSLVPEMAQAVRSAIAASPFKALATLRPQEPPDTSGKAAEKPDGHLGEHGKGETHEEGPQGVIKITLEQIGAAKIETEPAGPGVLARRLVVPGTIAPDSNRIARVAAKVIGTVAVLNKRLGDHVAQGEVIAILESREVADAKSEYLAGQVNFQLQKTLFEREQTLFEKKISAEQQFLPRAHDVHRGAATLRPRPPEAICAECERAGDR